MTERPKRSRSKPKNAAPEQVRPEPTARQKEGWAAAKAHAKSLPIRPAMKIEVEGSVAGVSPDGPEESGYLLYQALASSSSGFVDTKLRELINLARTGAQCTSAELDEALAFVSGVAPQNELETGLAVQIYGAQRMATVMMQRTRSAEYIEQMQAYGNLANKFARTAGSLTDTLMKLRRGGEQVVRHVHVYPGGQAVVAEQFHHHQGGANNGRSEQPYSPADAGIIGGCAALPGPDPLGNGVPVSGHAEREVLSSRRNESGGAEGQSQRV